ncbi:hypothetical protein HaloA020_35530 [Halomonas sp. A020]|uniref:acyltransferase n=1 Tax=Halomonas sp. A020 TaxID=2717374 RepID=UPI00248FEC54|nr:acyltransferase [Halomonas sp. A020]BCB62852.1 hypothetical protein HaloA020_35530 [Halomonas sp. A020]
MIEFLEESLPSNVVFNASFDPSSRVLLASHTVTALQNNKLKISIKQHSGKKPLAGVVVSIGAVAGHVSISLSDHSQKVTIGHYVKGSYMLRLTRKALVAIGDKTTSNGISVYCNNSGFSCGVDCMFSSDVLIQTSDQHGIVDLESGKIINDEWKTTVLGDHVWLGRNSSLAPNVTIGEGSVIGTGAIVTKNLPEKVVAVGVPAKIVKENHSWSRQPDAFDDFSLQYIQELS